jgi:hypothetical protein
MQGDLTPRVNLVLHLGRSLERCFSVLVITDSGRLQSMCCCDAFVTWGPLWKCLPQGTHCLKGHYSAHWQVLHWCNVADDEKAGSCR